MLNQPAPEQISESALLRLEDVSRVFDISRGLFGDRRSLVAVDRVSLSLAKGASIGLVGESGCGKSTLGRLACGLLTPSQGHVLLEGRHLPPAGANSWAAGRIQMIMSPLVEVIAHVQGGRLRPLAITTTRRSPLLPEIPTIAETIPGFEVALWNGFLAPTGTPPAVIARLAEETAAVLRTPEMQARLAEQGSEPVGSSPEQFAAFIRTEIPKWTEMVRLSGATAS